MAELAHLIPQVAMVLHYLHAAASLEKDHIYYTQNVICIMQSIYYYDKKRFRWLQNNILYQIFSLVKSSKIMLFHLRKSEMIVIVFFFVKKHQNQHSIKGYLKKS